MDLVVRFVMLVVIFVSTSILVAALFEGLPNVRLVQIAAVLSGQVPYGLFLMITVAYALARSWGRSRSGSSGSPSPMVGTQKEQPGSGGRRNLGAELILSLSL